MNNYVDHNFLINCANHPALRTRAGQASRSGVESFVLSPWHFYEVGKVDPARADEITGVVDDLNPSWILDRSDLQVGEFKASWARFWGMPKQPFTPIASLADIAAVLLRQPPAKLARFTLADFANVFRKLSMAQLVPVLNEQQAIAAANQISTREGKITPEVRERIERNYLALMLARSAETGPDEDALSERMRAINGDSFTVEMIKYFRKHGGMQSLRAWEIESILTDLHHAGAAELKANSQIDRQHAVMALSYCDRLITDDKPLTRLCAKVKDLASFEIAEIVTAEGFVGSLATR